MTNLIYCTACFGIGLLLGLAFNLAIFIAAAFKFKQRQNNGGHN